MDKIFDHLKAPTIYQEGNIEYWTNPLFSKSIIQGHLDQNHSGGSRSDTFMNSSVEFIQEKAPSNRYPNVIDLGCGPGLYCKKLSEAGYNVTGIDISEKAIEFAKNQASVEYVNINYKTQSFLTLNETNEYDIALLIYYLYGSISRSQRKKLLGSIYKSLKTGGILFMDVTSEANFNKFEEEQTWSFSNSEGSLSTNSYIGFRQALKYPQKTTLEKTTLLFELEEPLTFNIWNKSFTKNELVQEVEEAGFKIKGVYSDVAGKEFKETDFEIAIILEK